VFGPGSKRFSLFSQKRGSRWHRELFRLYWKRRSKASSHRPKVASETIALIREMARENRLWGAERIRGELLKLGIRVCKRTNQKYMRTVRTPRPRGQKWATFLHNHTSQIWACDAHTGHRSLLSAALCVLHHRIEVTKGHPRRRDTISDRSLGRAYRSGKPPPMGKRLSI
jgi:hypothetical protein